MSALVFAADCLAAGAAAVAGRDEGEAGRLALLRRKLAAMPDFEGPLRAAAEAFLCEFNRLAPRREPAGRMLIAAARAYLREDKAKAEARRMGWPLRADCA